MKNEGNTSKNDYNIDSGILINMITEVKSDEDDD
jgi:hypothetical protein